MDPKPTSLGVETALEQIDGFGCGPKRRKTGEDAYEEEGADAADDDDDDGARKLSLRFHLVCKIVVLAGGGGNEDEDLNSDDDDDDDAEVERTTEHIILCRYDKVARQKQKWKSQVPTSILMGCDTQI